MPTIYALRTTANREDQVMDFIISKLENHPEIEVYSIIRTQGMKGYIFVEAETRNDVEKAISRIPYARGLLASNVEYSEIDHMLEQVKTEVKINKSDIVELTAGPFKREQAKVVRVDQTKGDVVVELLEAAVPIPITVKIESVRVLRRANEE